jgi:ribonucleoside-triphosphate reductase
MEFAKNVEDNNVCHDCGKEIVIKDQEIENGVYLSYDNAGSKINIFKCKECFAKNPSLTNFQECEVYSRVVGYIRPVSQWHKGKKQEFGERKEFIEPKGVVNRI